MQTYDKESPNYYRGRAEALREVRDALLEILESEDEDMPRDKWTLLQLALSDFGKGGRFEVKDGN